MKGQKYNLFILMIFLGFTYLIQIINSVINYIDCQKFDNKKQNSIAGIENKEEKGFGYSKIFWLLVPCPNLLSLV